MANTYDTTLTIPVRVKSAPITPGPPGPIEEPFNWTWIVLGGGAVAALLIIFMAARR